MDSLIIIQYNSDGLPVIFIVYQKVYIFFNVIVGTFYQYHTFKTKIKI